ncbi:MAG TPA: cytochrome c biogenesis protein CcsA [bacterium]
MTTYEILDTRNLLLILELRAALFAFFLIPALFFVVLLQSMRILRLHRIMDIFLYSTLVLLIISTSLRWYETGRPPFQTLYESLIWFSMVTLLSYLVSIIITGRDYISGLIVLPLAAGATGYSLFFLDPLPASLPPALNSRWFFWHAFAAFSAYAILVVSFAHEFIRILARDTALRYRMRLFAYKSVLIAFPLLTFAIVSGAAWAEQAWGRYWSWDPKETWALATWTIYAAYLHHSHKTKLSGTAASVIGVLGFIAMVMTFLGVNWLAKLLGVPSIHAYTV